MATEIVELEKKNRKLEDLLRFAYNNLKKENNSGDLCAGLQEVLCGISRQINPNTVIITSNGGVMEVGHQPAGIEIIMVDFDDKK